MEILCFFSVTLALTANTQPPIATGGDLLEAFVRTGYTILTKNFLMFFLTIRRCFSCLEPRKSTSFIKILFHLVFLESADKRTMMRLLATGATQIVRLNRFE